MYVGGAVAIVSLFTGLASMQVHAKNTKIQYQSQLKAKETQVEEKQKVIQTTSKQLEEVKALKVDTEAQLKAKADKETQLQQELDKAKADLQAKAELKAAEAQVTASQAESIRVAQATTQVPNRTARPTGGFGGGANLYDVGYCTWYVKNRRPNIGDNWGNANQWYANAQADGYAVGATAKVGAVGVSFAGAFGHVVYVEGVNGDGTVSISEMNYGGGWNQTHARTTSASEFVYIY